MCARARARVHEQGLGTISPCGCGAAPFPWELASSEVTLGRLHDLKAVCSFHSSGWLCFLLCQGLPDPREKLPVPVAAPIACWGMPLSFPESDWHLPAWLCHPHLAFSLGLACNRASKRTAGSNSLTHLSPNPVHF